MNLLLLLSALLSALTGLGVQVRAPEVAQVVAGVPAKTRVAAVRRSALATRPAVALPGLAVVSAVGSSSPFAITAGEPRWATRRRE